MRRMRGVSMWVPLLLAVMAVRAGAGAPAVNLSGAWEMNRDLSSAPGGLPGPDGMGRPGGRGRGGPGGGPGGGGRGGGFGGGMGGGRRGGGGPPDGGRPSKDDMEARQALMQEIMTLPPRVTITQDGDKVVFIEPDGVVRTYVASGQAEKHQLTNGTIETKTSWDGPSLKMEIKVGPRGVLVRTFSVRDDPRRLEVATAFDRAPKDAGQLTVYDEAEPRR